LLTTNIHKYTYLFLRAALEATTYWVLLL